MEKPKRKNHSLATLSILAEAGSLGFTLAICLLLGVVVGRYCDNWLGTTPWGVIIFSIVGLITGSISLYKKAARLNRVEKNRTHKSEDITKGGPR